MILNQHPLRFRGLVFAFGCILLLSFLTSGCVPAKDETGLLSREGLRKEEIQSMDIIFVKRENPLISPSVHLEADNEDQWPHMQSIFEFIDDAPILSRNDHPSFSPLSESSHHMIIHYSRDKKMDFYYSLENNWVVWSNKVNQQGKQIIQYEFLTPDPGFSELLDILQKDASAPSQEQE